MAQYWRDFSADASASGAPTDFSAIGSFIDVGIAGSATATGKYLYFKASLGGRELTWNDPGTVTGTVKVFMDVYQDYSSLDRQYHGVMIRYQDDGDYVAQSMVTTASGSAMIYAQTAGSLNSTAISRAPVEYHYKRWHITMESVGGDVSLLIDEVSGSQTTLVNTSVASFDSLGFGRIGMRAFDNVTHTHIYGIGVGTAGDEAPTGPLSTGTTKSPSKGRIDLAGYAVTHQAIKAKSPVTGTIQFKGYTPSITAITPATKSPVTGTILLKGYTPTVTIGGVASKSPVTGTVLLKGYAVLKQAEKTKQALKGRLNIVGHAPTIATGSIATKSPSKGRINIKGYTPDAIAYTKIVQPAKGRIDLRGYTPSISVHVSKQVSKGTLIFKGNAVLGYGPITKSPFTGTFVLHGRAPTVSIFEWSAVAAAASSWSAMAATSSTWSDISAATDTWTKLR